MILKPTVYQYGFATLLSLPSISQYLTNCTSALHLFIFHCNLHLICLLLTALISHVNHVIYFSTCLLSVLAMLFFSEGHDCTSPLLLLFRNSFTEKTFPGNQTAPCQSATCSLVARRCIYFCGTAS